MEHEEEPKIVQSGTHWKLIDPAAIRASIGHGSKLAEKKYKSREEAERHLEARKAGAAVAPPGEAEIAAKYKHVKTHDGKHRLFIGSKMMEFDTEAELEKKRAALIKAAVKKAGKAA